MPESRQELRTKLQKKLRELFQFNASDLDFGIYQILNRKRDEIEEFIEQNLLNAIDEGLEEYQKEDASKYEDQLREAKNNIPDNAFNDDGSIKEDFKEFPDVKKYIEAKQALASLNVGEEIEKRIYQDLYTFFSRYYDDGDFLTQRRISTRDSKYAIPYNGEGVKLHWANKDQYYIKTGEHFANYKFDSNGLDIWFKVQQAEVEKDNVKESDTRYFVLRPDDPIEIDEENDTLTLWFEYRPLKDEEEEKWLEIYNEAAGKSLKTIDRERLCTAFDDWVRSEVTGRWRDALSTMPDDKEYSLLYEKLNHFTAKNTTDYFIHKNLQEFLDRELEYYLKHEVIQVDDFIKADSEQPLQTALTRAKVVRGIAEKVITFLSQIEDFQKKLFEKKKFVVDTHYCLTLDKVPEDLYETILENKEQLAYWEDCYSMDQWEKNLEWNGEWTKAALKSHPHMMVDTKFFEDDFKYKLLYEQKNIDDQLNGILFKSENLQILNLLTEKYEGKIDLTYIDPPYNTGEDDFIYKDNYKHSSWLALLNDRIGINKKLLSPNGVIDISVGPEELHHLLVLIKQKFGEDNFLGLISRITKKGGHSGNYFSPSVDYVTSLSKNKSMVSHFRQPLEDRILKTYNLEDEKGKYKWRNWYDSSLDLERSINARYGIEAPDGTIVYPPKGDRWRNVKETFKKKEKENEIEFRNEKGPHIDKNGDSVDWTIWYKLRPNKKGDVPDNIFDSNLNSEGTSEINKLGLKFDDFPKPPSLIKKLINLLAQSETLTVLDYFSGSGTTGQAVMDLNKNSGDRKYLLADMGHYFDTVLKPRLQKLAFSSNWKDGIPRDKDGQSHAFKYHFIESYEDALNNIDFKDQDHVQQAMEFDDYLLKYMLDFETKGVSATLLKDEAFKTPFDYELNIQRGHESPAPEKVDMVETFHYLIGLWVQMLRRYEHQGRKYIISKGEIRDEDAIEDVLVVWRKTEELDLDKEAEWITKEIIDDKTFDRIYVNGASKIKDAEPTEITFREKMFEGVA